MACDYERTSCKWRDKVVPKLEAKITELREEVAWWAGEGQMDRPEIVEWKTLAKKNTLTTAEDKRLRQIATKIRAENETAPELLERVSKLKAKNAELRKSLETILQKMEDFWQYGEPERNAFIGNSPIHIRAILKENS